MQSYFNVMSELLTRTISGAVLGIILIGSVLLSPWTYAFVMLFIVVVGTYEMRKLTLKAQSEEKKFDESCTLFLGETLSVAFFAIASLVGLQVLPEKWLLLELPILMLPFLMALFSTRYSFKEMAAYCYGSIIYLSLPTALMVMMFRHDLFGDMAGARLILLVFGLIWTNDIFAYLTGRLLGKHKLFPRISPGKTIEGSIGGLIFSVIAIALVSRYADWLPASAIGIAVITVVFGTLGDLCESMLKRQAGVKDSGTLIPGHGGILDRFDSIMFSVPFIFVYLQLI